MKYSLRFRNSAQREYDDAIDWYELQKQGLSSHFRNAVDKTLHEIMTQPYAHAMLVKDIRRAVVNGFPFCLYYRVRNDVVMVLSVFHTSRNPMIWQRR